MLIMKRIIYTLIGLAISILNTHAQSMEQDVEERLKLYLKEYQTAQTDIGTCRLDSVHIDYDQRRVDIYANATFGQQLFTPQTVRRIQQELKALMPGPLNYFDLNVHADGKRIGELVPNTLRGRKEQDDRRLWDTDMNKTKEKPWVTRTSRPYKITHGLEGRHLTLWQSHGRHYKNALRQWAWQRPPLFCTTEDLFTQSFVVPYIIPMLERAGATVFTPRERDTQRHEVIVDNDAATPGSTYREEQSRRTPWVTSPHSGFAHRKTTYEDGENPFRMGTARYAATTQKKKKKSHSAATWTPYIPETGSYAVYVSYQTMPGAVDDARYTVFHKGGATEFSINQRMGGGTWVYLGTFDFEQGKNDYGCVTLSNLSKSEGIVSADAVRFGGGMGNALRGGQSSGMPRYLEGARYWTQWAGMPYEVYAGYRGENDYADDINTRSHAGNYLAGGSAYNPTQKGLGVPLELSLGIHSDAGFTADDALVGSLGIYTTNYTDGHLPGGVSRYTSRDLSHTVLAGLERDLTAYTGQPWAVRGMWNRNYSESRLPAVPSMILETLSHQNFADLKLGHDPNFKFTLGRSVYKSILKYIATMHGKEYVVQPLPVNNLAVEFQQQEPAVARLEWTPVDDPLEPTAKATGYIVYTRIGYGGFDNGTYVKDTHLDIRMEAGLVYSFRVTAVNEGGESFPSETLAACRARKSKGTVLIVNAFDRLSSPATIETPTEQGFDLRRDAGVPYVCTTAFCGEQKGFDRQHIGKETEGGLGFSGQELEGMRIAGNTFDYPFVHGKAIQQAAGGGYSFVSCSDEAVENGHVKLDNRQYVAVDLILGMEKKGGHAATNGELYQATSPAIRKQITDYLKQGGRLMAGGAYMASELGQYGSAEEQYFLQETLKCKWGATLPLPPVAGNRDTLFTTRITGSGGLAFTIPRTLNEEQMAVAAPEVIVPAEPAFAALAYAEGNQCAAIAYPGKDYRTFIMGFPLECIREEGQRARLMNMALKFLTGDLPAK